MDFIDILIKATGDLASWLWDSVHITLRATPGFGVIGGLSPMMVMLGFLIILFGGWQLMNNKGE